ncbi:TetR/AcrR family transcriptional regulator [Flexivirga caeni]|uniref:TetR/AcrR family transcriptional regulator n=2 Tax=Flexivirga caeni TaxID=2294115 RepID=A0A3M9MFW3_9MICO|nr:TetR/AcrR family transcriptional regulator [Flexivirga caeni]
MAGGASDFTYEAVAARANTSRPVIYRRWPQRGQLLKAAIAHGGTKVRRTTPDTGSLRADLVHILTGMNQSMTQFARLITAHLEIADSPEHLTPAEVRDLFLGEQPQRMRTVMDRAIARGEADPDRVTDLVLSVPGDLVRQRLMLTLQPVSRAYVEAIVDQVFLPLVAPQRDSTS